MGLTRREAWVALASAMLALSTVMALAAHGGGPPRLIPYQATLEHDGEPVTHDVDLALRLFDAPTAGDELWVETLTDVPVEAGRLALVLGEVMPLPDEVFDQDQLWLELTVDGTTLASRQRVLPAVQAVAARQASTFKVTHQLEWSTGGELRDDQGGALELGGGQGTTPYIDFHTNDDSDVPNPDFTTRLLADGSGLRLQGHAADLVVDGDVRGASGSVTGELASASLAVTGVARVGALHAEATKICSAIVGGEWRTDIHVPDTWTSADCGAFAAQVGASSHTLGCLFRSAVGPGAGRKYVSSSSDAVPSPNCGW